jgi:hypothetical protein
MSLVNGLAPGAPAAGTDSGAGGGVSMVGIGAGPGVHVPAASR